MAVRTKRIAGPTLLVGILDVLLYTVPADRTALVKTVAVVNHGAANAGFELGLGGTGTGKGILKSSGIVAGSGFAYLDVALAFAPGDTIYARATTTNVLTVSLHGALLLGVSP